MSADPNETRTVAPETPPHEPPEPALDAGLAAAFGPDSTAGGWLQLPPTGDDRTGDAVPVGPPGERYRLLGEIDKGGMGKVYRAEDTVFGREVAVKVLRPDRAGPSAAARFAAEARITGRLAHPGIPAVHDLGTLPDGRPFLAMKLVKGRTLAELLAERPDPAADRGRFVRHFLQVCQTVAYAHSKGVIHRDLKPGNVMVGAFDEVLVMDWGLARAIRGEGMRPTGEPRTNAAPVPDSPFPLPPSSFRTGTGSVLGTPAFMPPEQATGDIDQIDERADVFGLGAVLCVILTGRPPYCGGTAEAVHPMAARGDLADAFARLDGCGADAELVGLCKRCLAADRTTRPRNAGKVADAVSGYLAGVEDRARRAELERAAAAAEAKEQWKRRRVQAALGLTFTALVALGGAFAWWQDRQTRDRKAEDEREATAQVADTLLELGRLRAEARSAADGGAGQWSALLIAVDRARALTDHPDVREESRDRLRRFLAEVEREDRDRRMAARLEAIRLWWNIERSAYDDVYPEKDPLYQVAFRDYGLDVANLDVEAAAAGIRDSAIRDQLLWGLDEWLWHRPADDECGREHLIAVARAADPTEWRHRLRVAAGARDRKELEALAGRPELLTAAPSTVIVLYGALRSVGFPPAAKRVLVAAQQRNPTDFWLNLALSSELKWRGSHPTRFVEAIGYARAAIAARPGEPMGYVSLANALVEDSSTIDQAIDACRRAIKLKKDYADAHNALGCALLRKKEWAESVPHFQRSLEIHSNAPNVHRNLGRAYENLDRLCEAVAEYKEAIRLQTYEPPAWEGLARTYDRKGELGEAVRWVRAVAATGRHDSIPFETVGRYLLYRKDWAGAGEVYRLGIRSGVKRATMYGDLGAALYGAGDRTGAIREFRTAVRLDANDVALWKVLGRALLDVRNYDEAAAAYRRARLLAPNESVNHNQLGFALLGQRRPGEALGVFHKALADQPAWAANPTHVLSYNAACAAVLCGTGQGTDAPPPTGRTALRREARDRLVAALATYRLRFAANPTARRADVQKWMVKWLEDPDFLGVRHPVALGFLPPDERVFWANLWAEVRALRDHTAPPPTAPPPREKR